MEIRVQVPGGTVFWAVAYVTKEEIAKGADYVKKGRRVGEVLGEMEKDNEGLVKEIKAAQSET